MLSEKQRAKNEKTITRFETGKQGWRRQLHKPCRFHGSAPNGSECSEPMHICRPSLRSVGPLQGNGALSRAERARPPDGRVTIEAVRESGQHPSLGLSQNCSRQLPAVARGE